MVDGFGTDGFVFGDLIFEVEEFEEGFSVGFFEFLEVLFDLG